ncbi:T-complex protein 1 subunit gamma [Fonticula alba]|uniref:T-complex protein 1 subunit gamma n=1 Tax=Fonticula alba TaxID=691883 RepID=A0A058Z8C1_FONAL|nr:T-complex protein 1 subunit gamma [Fonticula alba]KCV70534.1 T-complex protein 1 subunit gamma [Fonticula alba]|eukprot:XP_009495050.1 T-complex protein 1 subunit gamma [Fonticula alba]
MQAPVLVLQQNTKRQHGRKTQIENINAAKTVADIIRTCLGPRAMLKMLLDPMGGIVLTNDGNAILRECDIAHPAAKSMIELSHTQDEEVGDGTTSVIVLAGEVLNVALPFVEGDMHPTVIIRAFSQALEEGLAFYKTIVKPIDIHNREEMISTIRSSLGTKYVSRWSDLMCDLAYRAVFTVAVHGDGSENSRNEVDIKRFAKVEKVPGGEIEESRVLDGVMLNKDVTHAQMRRRIENPRILLLDCPLEYKKGESQISVEITKENDWNRVLQIEEEFIKKMCDDIIALKPDLVITEKGLSDLAQHHLLKAGISALRRVRKSDNLRIARACGATIVDRTEDIKESDIGTKCGLFYVDKIGDEYFSFIVDCKEPKACTLLLRGASKDVLSEVERNLQDAMNVARNVIFEPALLPGGGAAEMALATHLNEYAKSIEGIHRGPFAAIAKALEVIPRTLIQNCGGNVNHIITQLKAKHVAGQHTFGIDGDLGTLNDMEAGPLHVWEPFSVKAQTLKTAIEAACLLLRVDDIVSGLSQKGAH